jgi:glycosyltransferase involved in cell wall biosynthesis
LRIAIDARALSSAYENRGIGYHVKNLVAGLPDAAPDIRFVFFMGSEAAFRYLPARPNVERVLIRRTWRRRWLEDLVKLSREIRSCGADLFHGTVALGPLRDVNIPLLPPVPAVSTVYDLHVEILDDPQMKAYRREWRYRLQRRAVKRTFIVTCSDYTRKLLVERNIARNGGIRTIPVHYSGGEVKPEKKEQVVLFVGDAAHKNTAAAVKVFGLLASRAPGWRFVMIGSRDRIFALAGDAAGKLEASGSLDILENVPEERMAGLFASAEILFMPSLSEGFGVPVLQAFAHGTCAVISDRGSLPEVGGDAAAYVDPLDAEGMASSLTGLMKNESLRRTLVEKGKRRLEKYSAREHLGKLVGLYREMAERA